MKTNNCACGSEHILLEFVNGGTMIRVFCDDCGKYTVQEAGKECSDRDAMKKAVEKWNRLTED